MHHGPFEGQKFYSKAAIHAAYASKGYKNIVTHITEPGTDKNKITTRWF